MTTKQRDVQLAAERHMGVRQQQMIEQLRDELARVRALAIEFARGHACDSEDFDAFVASLGHHNY